MDTRQVLGPGPLTITRVDYLVDQVVNAVVQGSQIVIPWSDDVASRIGEWLVHQDSIDSGVELSVCYYAGKFQLRSGAATLERLSERVLRIIITEMHRDAVYPGLLLL